MSRWCGPPSPSRARGRQQNIAEGFVIMGIPCSNEKDFKSEPQLSHPSPSRGSRLSRRGRRGRHPANQFLSHHRTFDRESSNVVHASRPDPKAKVESKVTPAEVPGILSATKSQYIATFGYTSPQFRMFPKHTSALITVASCVFSGTQVCRMCPVRH